MTRKVEIDVDRSGFGTVKIDGHDVTEMCRNIHIKAGAGQPTTVLIELTAEVSGQAYSDAVAAVEAEQESEGTGR